MKKLSFNYSKKSFSVSTKVLEWYEFFEFKWYDSYNRLKYLSEPKRVARNLVMYDTF